MILLSPNDQAYKPATSSWYGGIPCIHLISGGNNYCHQLSWLKNNAQTLGFNSFVNPPNSKCATNCCLYSTTDYVSILFHCHVHVDCPPMSFLNFPPFECHDETRLTPIRMPSGHSTSASSAHDSHSLSVLSPPGSSS